MLVSVVVYSRSLWMITNPKIPMVDAPVILQICCTKSVKIPTCFTFLPFKISITYTSHYQKKSIFGEYKTLKKQKKKKKKKKKTAKISFSLNVSM